MVGPRRGKHEDSLYHTYLQKWFDVGNYREEDITEAKIFLYWASEKESQQNLSSSKRELGVGYTT